MSFLQRLVIGTDYDVCAAIPAKRRPSGEAKSYPSAPTVALVLAFCPFGSFMDHIVTRVVERLLLHCNLRLKLGGLPFGRLRENGSHRTRAECNHRGEGGQRESRRLGPSAAPPDGYGLPTKQVIRMQRFLKSSRTHN